MENPGRTATHCQNASQQKPETLLSLSTHDKPSKCRAPMQQTRRGTMTRIEKQLSTLHSHLFFLYFFFICFPADSFVFWFEETGGFGVYFSFIHWRQKKTPFLEFFLQLCEQMLTGTLVNSLSRVHCKNSRAFTQTPKTHAWHFWSVFKKIANVDFREKNWELASWVPLNPNKQNWVKILGI